MRLQIFLLLTFLSSYRIVLCQDAPTSDYNFNSSQNIIVDTLKNNADTSNTSSSSSNVDKVLGDIDSLKYAILAMQKEMNFLRTDLSNVQMNLTKSHKKHRTGAIIFGAGVAAYLFGAVNIANSNNPRPEHFLLALGGVGGIITGTVFMITSHRYIGKAGISMRRYSRNIRRE